MRLATVIGCALLLNTSGAFAFGLGSLTSGVKSMGKGSLLQEVNKKLEEQQVKDGQFEFKSGSAKFKPGNEKRISGLLKIINDNSSALKKAFPNMQVRAVGHTDSVGNAKKNKHLSFQRAERVCTALKAKGLKFDCLPKGVGADDPLISPEKTAADRQKNRRVVVQLKDSSD